MIELKNKEEYSELEKSLIDHKYSYNQLKEDIVKGMNPKRKRSIFLFKRRFDDYVGKKDAMKIYIYEEITSFLGLSFVFYFLASIFTLSRLGHIFVWHKTILTFVFMMIMYIFATLCLCYGVKGFLRILMHRNIYGILFGWASDDDVAVSEMQVATVIKNEELVPSYYLMDIENTDYGKMVLSDNAFVFNEIDRKLISNQHFILFMHDILIEHERYLFSQKYQKFDNFNLLKSLEEKK